MDYGALILRNEGYISPAAQERIRNTVILIAGCGIGSGFAETAIRLGYRRLILVDHDVIETHNLNRQNYAASDVGRHKVEALKARLLAINPDAEIEAICDRVTPENADRFVARSDLVFDTIDFLDMPGLVALHDASHEQKKPLVTAVNAGYGAAAFYFPKEKSYTIRDLFDLPRQGSVRGISYAEKFTAFIERISEQLDPLVVKQFFRIVRLMGEGKPCPAPQVSPGGACVAALAGTVAVRIAENLPIREAPDMLMINLSGSIAPAA
jgi:molybdopterin/thiamine biosynthesis adenylyltransferase